MERVHIGELDERDWGHLWLADDGSLLVASGLVWRASHIASLAELRALYGRETVTVEVLGEEAADSAARWVWLDVAVDVVVERRYAQAYGALDDSGWRTELMSGLRVRPVAVGWEIETPACETRRVADWAAVLSSGDDISWC